MVRENVDIFDGACPSREVLDLIGDKWTVLILRAMCNQRLRYSQIHKRVGGISQKVLTASLRKLERDGILSRIVYPVVPPKVEYQLTALGGTLFDVLGTLQTWAIDHLQEVEIARDTYDNRPDPVAATQ